LATAGSQVFGVAQRSRRFPSPFFLVDNFRVADGNALAGGEEEEDRMADPLKTERAFVRNWAALLRQVIVKVHVEALYVVGVERIKFATSSGSSIWTKCRAVGRRNESEAGNNS